jgi:hypothetical protein
VALKSDVHQYPFMPDGCRLKDTMEKVQRERSRRVLFRVVVRLAKATAVPRGQKFLKRVLLAAPVRIASVRHANNQRDQQGLTLCTNRRGVHQNRLL